MLLQYRTQSDKIRQDKKEVILLVSIAPANLTISQVAEMLQVHINTLRRWSNQGRIKSYRVGGNKARVFAEEDVRQFLADSTRAHLSKKR